MKNNIALISAPELMLKLNNRDDLQLIDVREHWEHNEYNIGGANFPLHCIFENTQQICRDKIVVLYCQKGIRSQIAIQRLQQRLYFTNLVNLTGGMEAWKREVKKNVSDIPHH